MAENGGCVTFLQSLGIIRSSSWCESCGVERGMVKCAAKIDGCLFRCPLCKSTISPRSGSFLEKSKLTLQQFILLVYFWASDSSCKQLVTYLGLSKVTIVDWTQFLRDICSWRLLSVNQQIGGPGKIIQIDESLIYKPKYNIGHALFARKKWIMGFYDVSNKIGFVRFLENRSSETLLTLILQHVLPGSVIHTDCWAGYSRIAELPVSPQYIHKTVNHSRNFVDPITGCHTNNVEAFWRALKAKFKRMNGTAFGHTASYLDEHEYRKLYGGTAEVLFNNILADISERYVFE